MKVEGLLGRTLRARPSGINASMGLAARAGFVRPCEQGWVLLPLGLQALDRMADVLLDDLGCQKVGIAAAGGEEAQQVLGDLVQAETQSYRQLPLRIATTVAMVGQSPVPPEQKGAALTLIMAEAAADAVILAGFLDRAEANVVGLARGAGLHLESARGVGDASAVVAPTEDGGTSILGCATCGTGHLREAAPFMREALPPRAPEPMSRVHTPGTSTIASLAEFLGVGCEQTLKVLFLTTDGGELIFTVVRGDLDASMEKLAHVVGAGELRAATEAEIMRAGAVPGFASPIGLRVRKPGERGGLHVIADPSVFTSRDFVAGANARDYHFVHVDPARDMTVTEVVDVALAPASAACAVCGSALVERKGRLIARRLPLRAHQYADETGSERRGAAGCLVVDMLGLLEHVVGACADEAGIAWPVTLAPAEVFLISLKEDEATREAARVLEASGVSFLLDDRAIGAGVKFADADLIGCPQRVTVSARSLQAGGAELACRRGTSPAVVPLAGLPDEVRRRIAALMST